MGLYQRLWQNLGGLHRFEFYYLMPSSSHGLSLLVETRKTDVTSVYLTQSSFILSVLLRVFQVRKHNLISALVADPDRVDTIRRLTKNGRILLPADEIEPCINFFYRLSLGDGATKLVHRISEHYFGISKNRIVSFLNANVYHMHITIVSSVEDSEPIVIDPATVPHAGIKMLMLSYLLLIRWQCHTFFKQNLMQE